MLALAVPLLLATSIRAPHYLATPQAAALAAIYPEKGPPRIVRTNVVGTYATVLIAGAMMEGAVLDAPILVERFPFGWQALQVLNDGSLTCGRIGPTFERALMRGMPRPQIRPEIPCGTWSKDVGPQADVLAVRMVARGPLIPAVHVSHGYALAEWYGAGGGQTIYRKANGAWTVVTGGGGVLGVNEMRSYGVPQDAWCDLGVYNAHCPAR